jgi:hypothetical protein
MSIKFTCSCGKHLRARDEMAARRSMCPRCGKPVGIPSLRPTHAGTAVAPLTPLERLRHRRDTERTGSFSSRVEDAPHSVSNAAGSPLKPTGKTKVRRRRQLELRWYQCLAYPFLNLRVFFCFALLLSLGVAGLLLTLQNLPPLTELAQKEWVSWLSGVLVVGLLVSYAYATVECALISALAGQGPAPCWPGLRIAFPLKSAIRWMFCFLAGPIVAVGLAVYLWLYGGDLKPLDWVILAELGIFASAYWLLAIVSANERNRLRDANPVRVALLVHRLKQRALVPVFMAPTLVIVHVLLGLYALSSLHHTLSGLFLLIVCWCSILFWAAFLFRLLGVWCYYTKPTEPEA